LPARRQPCCRSANPNSVERDSPMPNFPADIFTEPSDVAPDTLANLGPC
jgi:hypothetical protein